MVAIIVATPPKAPQHPSPLCWLDAMKHEILHSLVDTIKDGIPEDAVLTHMHHQLSELASGAQSSIHSLDRSLDKLSKAQAAITAEFARRREPPPQEVKSESLDIEEPKRFVPNPKSEFVASQFVPVDKLELFQEEEGDEGLKKKLGVVSYPANDLLDMLPGPVPDEDFTKSKPQNQVQFSTFATFLEPYFRAFNEEDLSFLQQKTIGSEVVSYGRTISPYTIPPLGPVYTENWAEEDGPNPPYNIQAPPISTSIQQYTPSGSLSQLTEENLENGKVALGPFGARLMAAILSEDEDETFVPCCASELPKLKDIKDKHPYASFAMLEDRLRREFHYVGMLDVNILNKAAQNRSEFKLAIDSVDIDDAEIDWVNTTEDDEICREMRQLQAKLKQVTVKNQKYKRRLLPHVEEQMAWQEYSSILDDLDKQIDQAYMRRLRVPKPKKKKPTGTAGSPPADPTPPAQPAKILDQKPAVQASLEKRSRWVQKIGSVFPAQHLILRSHRFKKFEGEDDVEEEEEEE